MLESSGVDVGFDASYALQGSTIRANILWSHFLDYERKSFPGDDPFDLVGRYTGSSFAEDKANFLLSWTWNDLRVSYLGEYIGGLTAPVSFLGSYEQDIDSQMYHDIVAEYNFGSRREPRFRRALLTSRTKRRLTSTSDSMEAQIRRLTVCSDRATTSGSDNLSNPCLINKPGQLAGFFWVQTLISTHETAAADAPPSAPVPVRRSAKACSCNLLPSPPWQYPREIYWLAKTP